MLRVFRDTLSDLGMELCEWPDLVPLDPFALNKSPSSQHLNIALISIFKVSESLKPLLAFHFDSTANLVSLPETPRIKTFNMTQIQDELHKLLPISKSTLEHNLIRARRARSRSLLLNLAGSDFILVTRSEILKRENLHCVAVH